MRKETGCWDHGGGTANLLPEEKIHNEREALGLFEEEQSLALGDGLPAPVKPENYGRIMAARRFERLTRPPSSDE